MSTVPARSSRLLIHRDHGFLDSLLSDRLTVMVGGFGEPGTPFYLLDRLAALAPVGLTVVKNDANEPGVGVGALLRSGALTRLIASHIGLNPEMVAAMNRAEVDVEFNPQGILAERIRCGGVGLPGFLSDIGVGLLNPSDAEGGDRRREIDWGGRRCRVEPALRADLALIRAQRADPFGNLVYRRSARNFNPLMAMAAEVVVAEVAEVVEHALDPEEVHTPGCFVDHLVPVPAGYDPGTRGAAIARGGDRAG